MSFKRTYEVRWADLDPNFHLRHSAYADYGAQGRMAFLSAKGFTLEKFREMNVGPVLFTESLKYLREVKSGDSITVHVDISEVSTDGRKWTILHQITRGDGETVAEILVTGAWFDTTTRKVCVPPPALMEAFRT